MRRVRKAQAGVFKLSKLGDEAAEPTKERLFKTQQVSKLHENSNRGAWLT